MEKSIPDDALNPWAETASGIPDSALNPWAEPEPETVLGEIPKGLKAGVQQLRGMGYGIGALAGKVAGSEDVTDWAKEGLADVEAQTPKPAVASYKDVTDLESAGKYLAYGVASNLPNLALAFAGGVGGAAAGAGFAGKAAAKEVVKQFAKRGAMAGAGLSSLGMETGSIAADQLTETGEVSPLRAMAGAIPAAMLDVVPEWYLMKKLGLFGDSGFIGKGIKDRLKYAGKTGLQQAGMEAPTEAMQSVIERASVPGKNISNSEAWDEYINSFILGGATGGVAGGVGGVFAKADTPVQRELSNDPLANSIERQISTADPEGLTRVPQTAWDASRVPVRQPSQEPPPPAPVPPAEESNVAGPTLTPEEIAIRNMNRGNVVAGEAEGKRNALQVELAKTAEIAARQKGFASEAEALMSIRARRLNPEDFAVEESGGRWMVTPKSAYEGIEQERNDVAQTDEEITAAREIEAAPAGGPTAITAAEPTSPEAATRDISAQEGLGQAENQGIAAPTGQVAPKAEITPTRKGKKAKTDTRQMGLFGEEPSFSFGKKPPAFYSKAQKVVEDSKISKMSLPELKSFLKNKQVSPDEIEEITDGLEGTVTKEALLENIRLNSTELTDVVYGEGKFHTDVAKSMAISEYKRMLFRRWGDNWQQNMSDEQAEELNDLRRAPVGKKLQYDAWQEPGFIPGTEREILVTVPSAKISGASPPITDSETLAVAQYREGMLTEGEAKRLGVKFSKEMPEWEEGHPGYQGVKNMVVRLRVNERTATVAGKELRVLFVEEMQGPSPTNQKDMPEYLRKRIFDIGVKRALAHAKAAGLNGVAWTTGEMQAERYDLSRKLDKIRYRKDSDNINVTAYRNGEEAIDKDFDPDNPSELERFIGKELTQKIYDDKKDIGVFSGLDLKFGGEGLKSLYDRTLPAIFKKYGKENVGSVEIGAYFFDDNGKRFEDGESRPAPVPFIPITEKTLASYPVFTKAELGGANLEKVRSIASTLTKGLRNAFPVEVYSNVKDDNMPVDVLDAMYNYGGIDEDGNSDVAGMVLGGKVYLFADNIDNDADAIRVVAKHELFHNGFQVLFQKLSNKSQKFMPYLGEVNSLLDEIWKSKEVEVRKNAGENQSQLNLETLRGRRKAAEEWLAQQAPDTERGVFDRLVSIVRRFLKDLGLDLKLSDAEVRTIIRDSYGALRGEVSTGIKNSPPAFAFSGKSPLGKISGHARSLGSRVLAGTENPSTRVGRLKTDIATYFAARSAKDGIIDYRKNDPKDNKRVEKYLREFFDVAVAKHPKALGWYRGDLKETFDILTQIAPELENKENRFVMNLALAITSDGNNNIDNVRLGYEVYENWKKNKTLLTPVEARRKAAIRDGLRRADGLRQAFGSLAEYESWLLGKVPKEILQDEVAALLGITREEAAFIGNGEAVDAILPRSVVFGPKLGGAFFPNLSGDFDTTTIDQWFMRTIGRITGDLVEGGSPAEVKAQRDAVLKAVKESPEGIKLVRKMGGEQLLLNAPKDEQADILATTIEKLSRNESFRQKLGALKGGDALRMAANNRVLYTRGALPKDAPDGPGHRKWLRERMRSVREKLAKEGKNYDNADIQAVMWIGEKELWKKYGIRQTEGDYYSAGANALHERIYGRPSELFTGGARGVGDAGRASMEQGALFSRQGQGTDRTKTERAYGMIGQIVKIVEANPNGFTINISDGTTQKTGYAVSPAKMTDTRLDVLTEDDLLGFLNKFEAVFNSDDRAFLGGWYDSETDKFVLDISFVVDSLNEALYLAENGEQDAIYDITNQNEIRTADGIAGLKERRVYSESERDALRGVQESLRQTIQGSGPADGSGAVLGRGNEGAAKDRPGDGRVPNGAVSTFEGFHYSSRYRDYLDSSAYGTGLKGAEHRRVEGNPDLLDRINMYYDAGAGIKKEPGLGNYAHRIPPIYNFYDTSKDSLGLVKNSPDFNSLERAVMANGYDGYSNSKRGVAILLGKRNIKVRPTTKTPAPKTAEEPSFSRRAKPPSTWKGSAYEYLKQNNLLDVARENYQNYVETRYPGRTAPVEYGPAAATGKMSLGVVPSKSQEPILSFEDWVNRWQSTDEYKTLPKAPEQTGLPLGEEPSFSFAESTRNYIDAARNAWQSPDEGYKYPGIIKRSFEYVFGSPEHSRHPVMKALSRVFIERNGWFNEYFLRFAEGDHPGRVHDTMSQAIDSLEEAQYEAFGEIDNDMDISGYTQDEAREYMQRNNVDPAVVEVWEAKTARFSTVMDSIIESVQEQVDEIDGAATFRGIEPSYPRISYEMNEAGEPDLSRPVNLKDYLGLLEEMKTYAYSPRIRENGAFEVRAENAAAGRKFMQFAKSKIAAEKLKIDLVAEGWENITVGQARTVPESVLAGLKEMDILKLVNEAIEKTDTDAVTSVYSAELSSALHNIILARGYRRHQIGRQQELVEGYELDPRKKIFAYLVNSSAGMAKAKAAKQAMQIMIGGTKEDTAEGASTAKTLGEYHAEPINPSKEGRTYDAAKKYIADNLRNVEDADRAIAFIKKLATFKYLSWTLRAPLVNTTALITTVAPSLHQYAAGGKGSFIDIFKEIGKASTQYIRVMRGERGMLTTSEQGFVDDINRRQYDEPQMVRDMMTSMQGSSGRTFDNIVQWGMKPFSYIEQWMRGLTMLAGYRIAKKGGMSELDAREAAIQAASNAHGVYGKATRQYWAQGTDPAARIGQVATTFLKFPQNYLNLLYDLGYDKGNIKAFTWALAAPIVLGGAAAIPFKDNIVWMINSILKGLGDDRDMEKMVYDDARKYLGPEAEKNLRTGLAGLAGVDITGSLSMNIGLPTDLLSLTGIFGAMAKETYRAGHFVTTGQYSKALETVLPSLPANIFRSVRELDGATTISGNRVWNEDGTPYIPSKGETALRIAGFRGSKRTTTQQRDWETTREKQRWDESKGKIYERYRAYLSDAKPGKDEFQLIMQDVSKFNKAIVARGRAGLVVPIRPGQLKKIVRDMARQSNRERRQRLAS